MITDSAEVSDVFEGNYRAFSSGVSASEHEAHGLGGPSRERAERGRDARVAGPAHEGDGQVAAGGEHLRGGTTPHLAPIFVKDDIADVVRAVLDPPMAA